MRTPAHNSLHNPKGRKVLSEEERAYADTQRAAGRPWSAIARMLDCSEHLVRTECDPDYPAVRL